MFLIDDVIDQYLIWRPEKKTMCRTALQTHIRQTRDSLKLLDKAYIGVGHEYGLPQYHSSYSWALLDLHMHHSTVTPWDILLGIPFADHCLQQIYCKHTIGMLEVSQVEFLFSEVKRTLSRKGVFELRYTDLDMVMESYTSAKIDSKTARRFLYGNHMNSGQYRKSIWTEKLLAALCFTNDLEIINGLSKVGSKTLEIKHLGAII